MAEPHGPGTDGRFVSHFSAPAEGTLPVQANVRPAASARWWGILLFALVFAASFASLHWRGGGSGWWVEDIYRSVGLFSGNTGWGYERSATAALYPPFAHQNIIYQSLAIFAPILSVLGLVQLTTGRIGRALVFCRVWCALYLRRRRSIGVVGLTELSSGFALDLAASSGRKVFVLAERVDTGLADRCERAGIAVCHFTPRAAATDRKAARHLPVLARRADAIVSFLPSIDAQVDLFKHVAAWSPLPEGGKDGLPFRLFLLVANRGLNEFLVDRLSLGAGTAAQPALQPRMIDAYSLAARQLLTQNHFDVLADAFGQDRIHLVIYGFGTLGRAIVKQAAQLYVTNRSFDAKAKLRITIIDRRGSAAFDALKAEAPCIEEAVEFAQPPCPTDVTPGGLNAEQVAALVPACVTGHILTFKDPDLILTTALSLRRWLLEPPATIGTQWRDTHVLAPIFVQTSAHGGVGALFRDAPSGIYAYGALHDCFGVNTILDDTRERGAMAIHAAYHARVKTDPDQRSRPAADDWAALSPALRESNFHAYDHLPIKARAIGYRAEAIQDEADGKGKAVKLPPGKPFSQSDRHTLERLEHLRYLAERLARGWRPGPRRFYAARVHPDLVKWDMLHADERALDRVQIDALPAIAEAARKRLAPAFVVGVSGLCNLPASMSEKAVRGWLSTMLQKLRDEHPDHAMLLLTSLAKGADQMAAEAAIELRIPFIVPLPLPYELLLEDFPALELARFKDLIARAEYNFEMPMLFGCATELTRTPRPLTAEPIPEQGQTRDPNEARRAQQYALAGMYIAQRANEMLFVLDHSKPADAEVGSARFIYNWREQGKVTAGYPKPTAFFPPLNLKKPSQVYNL